MSKNLMTNVLLKLSKFAASIVNVLVGWCKLFKAFFRTLRSNIEWNWRKPSSIYILNNSWNNLKLSWENYFGSSARNKTSSSKNPTEKLVCSGANSVPITSFMIGLNI